MVLKRNILQIHSSQLHKNLVAMDKIQKVGGVVSILLALTYINAFIVYGIILVFPEIMANSARQVEFLTDNQLLLQVMDLITYVIFGILLVILVSAVYHRIKTSSPVLSQIASVFGLIWAGFVIASGMIGNIGLNAVVELGSKDPERAMLIWSSIGIVKEGLGGGNEIVGGIWVLLLSFAFIKKESFPKLFVYLGFIVGLAGILTIYPIDIFAEIFGISHLFWFILLGILMLRKASVKVAYE